METILKGFSRLDSSVSVISSWEKSLVNWSQQILGEIPTWLDTQKKLHPDSVHVSLNVLGDERNCKNCDFHHHQETHDVDEMKGETFENNSFSSVQDMCDEREQSTPEKKRFATNFITNQCPSCGPRSDF